MPVLLLRPFEDAAELRAEIASNFSKGRAFLPGDHPVSALDTAILCLSCAETGREATLEVRVVMVVAEGPMAGVGVELPWTDDTRAAIEGMLEPPGRWADAPASDEASAPDPGSADPVASPPSDEPPGHGASADDPSAARASDAAADADAVPSDPTDDDAADSADADSQGGEPEDAEAARKFDGDPRFHRIRKLSLAERAKMARDGLLDDRIMLERLYGRAVWEDLLRNPQLTAPEVARIAGKGTVPTVLLELIVGNQAWSRQSLVRNALLRNPRLASDSAQKLLRGMSKIDLRLVTQTAIYPAAIRSAAKKMLGA